MSARKVILRTGVYEAPQGKLNITPKRIRHWMKQFRAMRDQGILIPVAWGHQPDAEPVSEHDRAKKQYHLSAYNAGYLDDLGENIGTGELFGDMDVPGCWVDKSGNLVTKREMPDGTKLTTAIKEVSAAIKDWKDGRGKLWKDAIVHVALTPLPVVAGQSEGFTRSSKPAKNNPVYLSLSERLYSLGTEDTDMDNNATASGGGNLQATLEALASRGITLPEDTTDKNFHERLHVAVTALDGGEPGEAALDDGMLDDEEFVDEGDEEFVEEDEFEDEEDVEMNAVEGYDEEDEDDQGDVMEEKPYMLSTTKKSKRKSKIVTLSTISESEPMLASFFAEKQEKHRKDGLRVLDKAVQKGLVSVAEANSLRAEIGGYELATTAEGELRPRKVDIVLSTLDMVLRNTPDKVKGKRESRPEANGSPARFKDIASAAKDAAKRFSIR